MLGWRAKAKLNRSHGVAEPTSRRGMGADAELQVMESQQKQSVDDSIHVRYTMNCPSFLDISFAGG